LYTNRYKKRAPIGKILFVLLLLGIVAGGFYVKFSTDFEHKLPTIYSTKNIYWNTNNKIDIKLYDKSGIKSYNIVLQLDREDILLENVILTQPKQNINLKINYGSFVQIPDGTKGKLIIKATDKSHWSFFKGNTAVAIIDITIDNTKPKLSLVANSKYIRQGGSAVAVIKLSDTNLKEKFLVFAGSEKFELIPFVKGGYYIVLFAWPMGINEFSTTYVEASDKANNKSKLKIPLFINKKDIKIDKIKISKKFIKNTSTDVLKKSNMSVPKNLEKRFKKQNELLRAENIRTIKQQTKKHMDKNLIDSFDIKPFKRLDKSIKTANFAQRRHYYFQDKKISEAWHLGLDWASVRNAPIIVSNKGKVIFDDYLGIYGNSIIIDHKLGLSSLYSHTNKQFVKAGDTVSINQKLAETGATGAVLGDHLHFGILMQGVEADPNEWLDKKWLEQNILNTIQIAKETIKDETKNN